MEYTPLDTPNPPTHALMPPAAPALVGVGLALQGGPAGLVQLW